MPSSFFGAFYAICLALGRLKTLAFLLRISYAAYAGLVVATVLFAWAMNLTGWWLALVVVLLVGYFVAPRAIWRLSVATHESTEPEPGSRRSQR